MTWFASTNFWFTKNFKKIKTMRWCCREYIQWHGLLWSEFRQKISWRDVGVIEKRVFWMHAKRRVVWEKDGVWDHCSYQAYHRQHTESVPAIWLPYSSFSKILQRISIIWNIIPIWKPFPIKQSPSQQQSALATEKQIHPPPQQTQVEVESSYEKT